MLPHIQLPTPALVPFVTGYAEIDVTLPVGQTLTARVTPIGCPAILLLDQGHIRITDGPAAEQHTTTISFTGQLTRSGGTEYPGSIHGFLLQLAPAGAHDLLGCPVSRYQNTTVPLDQVLGAAVAAELQMALEAHADFASRCAVADAWLLAYMARRQAAPGLGAQAAQLLTQSQGMLEMEQVAAQLHVSVRTLLRRFTQEVGMAPKLFARLMRFRAAHAFLQEPNAAWPDAVLRFGYTDQSHLIRDYRHFAGETPRHYQHEVRTIDRVLRLLDTEPGTAHK